MARVEGFEPAKSGQEPVNTNGDPVPVGVWGDSTTGAGVFATTGALAPGVDDIPIVDVAGVIGHGITDAGVWGESGEAAGVVGRSATGDGVLGVTFVPAVQGQPSGANGVFGVGAAGGDGVVGLVGDATGVVGNSIRGTGVRGLSGSGPGVVGESLGAGQAGVSGRNDTAFGVQGVGDVGVLGSSGRRFGVVGASSGEPGVWDRPRSAGVLGSSGTATGVLGQSFAQGQSGIRGQGFAGHGVVGESAGQAGVFGRGIGIFEEDRADVGVRGLLFSATSAGIGVEGISTLGNGVDGFSFAATGVRGEGRERGVHGVVSQASDPSAAGVVGEHAGDPQGRAGLFLGNVVITGSLSKAGGGFEIDHPLDPGNRYLRHSFVESPDMLNVYSGTVTTGADGRASVTLPQYVEVLNEDFRYQLTVIGRLARVAVEREIENDRFTVMTDEPQVKVSWQVTGVRRDPWAVSHRIVVDEEKTAEERGRYLHPELWEQPEEASIRRSPVGEDQLRRDREKRLRLVHELVPEQLHQRVDQHLQALLQGDDVDRAEFQDLLTEARQMAELHRPYLEERPSAHAGSPQADRARLEEELRRAEEVLQGLRATSPRSEGAAPS